MQTSRFCWELREKSPHSQTIGPNHTVPNKTKTMNLKSNNLVTSSFVELHTVRTNIYVYIETLKTKRVKKNKNKKKSLTVRSRGVEVHKSIGIY